MRLNIYRLGYQRRESGLFAAGGFEKRSDYSERLLELYRAQLRSAFGIDAADLFPDPDDLHDPLGDPKEKLGWY